MPRKKPKPIIYCSSEYYSAALEKTFETIPLIVLAFFAGFSERLLERVEVLITPKETNEASDVSKPTSG
jgi:hypothetical protein